LPYALITALSNLIRVFVTWGVTALSH
jgi:hypothetical protein